MGRLTYQMRQHLNGLESAGKPEAVLERKIQNEAWRNAGADRSSKYPQITPDNFEQAWAYTQERRQWWEKRIRLAHRNKETEHD